MQRGVNSSGGEFPKERNDESSTNPNLAWIGNDRGMVSGSTSCVGIRNSPWFARGLPIPEFRSSLELKNCSSASPHVPFGAIASI